MANGMHRSEAEGGSPKAIAKRRASARETFAYKKTAIPPFVIS